MRVILEDIPSGDNADVGQDFDMVEPNVIVLESEEKEDDIECIEDVNCSTTSQSMYNNPHCQVPLPQQSPVTNQ